MRLHPDSSSSGTLVETRPKETEVGSQPAKCPHLPCRNATQTGSMCPQRNGTQDARGRAQISPCGQEASPRISHSCPGRKALPQHHESAYKSNIRLHQARSISQIFRSTTLLAALRPQQMSWVGHPCVQTKSAISATVLRKNQGCGLK